MSAEATYFLPQQLSFINRSTLKTEFAGQIKMSSKKNQPNCLKRNDVLHDRYVIQNLLGQGKFGRVFKVFDKVNKKEVALKRIDNAHLKYCDDEVKFMRLANKHRTLGRSNIGEHETFNRDPIFL